MTDWKIFADVNEFMEKCGKFVTQPLVVTSGGFDPVHIGHLRCIQGTVKIARKMGGLTVIIVNGDGFLVRKKGKPFMSHQERMEIISGIEGVDFVVGWDDGSQTVTGCLDILRPAVFAKGGDRSDADKVPEFVLCEEIGCEVRFGVGGREKVQSSSDLISRHEKVKQEQPDDFDLLYRDDVWEKNRQSRFVEKPWGSEEILVEAERYVAKILNIEPHQRLSKQYHEVKDETIFVFSGTLKLEIGDDDDSAIFFLQKGDVHRIEPGTIHRFSSWDGAVKVFEVSTPELDDVVRLSDDYGRHKAE